MEKKIHSTSTNNQSAVKILIIEDDETIRHAYSFLLANEPDFEVINSYTSYEAAEKDLILANPDIILLDVQLPGIRGVDAIPNLKRLLPGVHVIVLTVYESEEVIFTALRNGASGYLTKNIESGKLIEAIRDIMNGGGSMSTGIAKMVMRSFQKNINSPLTKRETQVLESIAEGKSRNSIAGHLFIDLETVKTHIKNIYHKLNVNSREEALRVAKKSRYI